MIQVIEWIVKSLIGSLSVHEFDPGRAVSRTTFVTYLDTFNWLQTKVHLFYYSILSAFPFEHSRGKAIMSQVHFD